MMLKNKNAVIYGTVVLFRRTAVTMPLAAVAEDAVRCDRRRDRVAPTHPAPLHSGLLSNLHSKTTLRRHSWQTPLQNF